MGETAWYDILLAVQEAMTPYARRGIHANVDFFAGAVYYLIGIPQDLFVPIFAVGITADYSNFRTNASQHTYTIASVHRRKS